jgi:hypothetical protein
MRLFASPKLFEIRISFSASRKRKAPVLPPRTSNATSVDAPDIWRAMISACG